MQFDTKFSTIWSEDFPSNIESLGAYRFERARNYPGVPVRHFTDWHSHKSWMDKTRKDYLRMMNNHRIQDELEQAQKEEQKG